jgi:hypothetical protein
MSIPVQPIWRSARIIDNSICADLGSGTSYGSLAAGSGISTDIVSFALNSSAFTDINGALGGYFSLGATSTGGTSFNRSGSGGSPSFIQKIVLVTGEATVIAEPASLAIFSIGLEGLGCVRRRKAA